MSTVSEILFQADVPSANFDAHGQVKVKLYEDQHKTQPGSRNGKI
jgi:hypothetical protein